MKNSDLSIVCFHTGRGGRFHNAGHVSFIGEKDLYSIINSGKNDLFYYDRDKRGRFISPAYFDCNGCEMITVKEANTGVGTLNWDNDYDTDTCIYLKDCSESELRLINDSDDWNKDDLVRRFFDENEFEIDWNRFNGDYDNLVDCWFNFGGRELFEELIYELEEVE